MGGGIVLAAIICLFYLLPACCVHMAGQGFDKVSAALAIFAALMLSGLIVFGAMFERNRKHPPKPPTIVEQFDRCIKKIYQTDGRTWDYGKAVQTCFRLVPGAAGTVAYTDTVIVRDTVWAKQKHRYPIMFGITLDEAAICGHAYGISDIHRVDELEAADCVLRLRGPRGH